MKKRIPSFLLLLFLVSFISGNLYSQSIENEITGIDNRKPNIDLRNTSRDMEGIPAGGLLLIPESNNDQVMAFDPVTGNLLDANFIPPDPTNLSTPIEAILSADGQSILVSDQINDVVQEYDLEGNYLGIFAPAGGANTAILDNIRGIVLRSNGNLLVTVGAGANQGNLAEFDADGNYLGIFFNGPPNDVTGPFDVMIRPGTDYLIAEINNDKIVNAGLNGAFISNLAVLNNFPEQIFVTGSGNVLVGNFGGTQEGVVELTSTGTLIGVYNPPGISGNRGVYELPNGNILTTSGSGVYEIDRLGNIIDTKISAVSARFITFIPGPEQPEIPLSPYMILLAVGLIALFTYFRYRR